MLRVLDMPIQRDGAVTRGTRQNLINGLRAKPMSAASVDGILGQATNFTERLVDTYEAQIARGEVGTGGAGRASEAAILAPRPPACLMYGRVQSGKTAMMILTSALCLDNGFRVIIVLTADNLALVEQTTNRFKDLNGPRVFSSIRDDVYEWEGQEDEIRADIRTDGLILVCAKDAFHLPRIINFLQQIEAPSYPAIVFDDEADAATPDTTLAARSAGRPTAPQFPSTINRRIIENQRPGEEGESVGEILPHGLYVQVTATPFLLFLQRRTSRIRPNVTFVVEPGADYCGGETFFVGFDPAAARPTPPIVLVPANEAQTITRRRVPDGLAASINFFLLAAAAKGRRDDSWPTNGFKHLSHTSSRIDQHTVVANHIERHVTQLRRQLRDEPQEAREQIFATAYEELQRTVPEAPPLAQLLPVVGDIVRQVEIIRINSATDVPRYGPRINFIVGGNILGRGLTIDDLLVTYYIREAQTSQMDTVWQHARMYGYRRPLMPFTRVYLTQRLATRFKDIHESEEQLRELLRREAAGEDVPIRVAMGSRATRANATEPSVLQVYRAGLDQLIPRFIEEDGDQARQIRQALLDLDVPLAADDRAARVRTVPLDDMIELIELVPIRPDDPGRWNVAAITAVIESFRDQYNGLGPVYVRRLEAEPGPEGWLRGRLSGDEIRIIRQAAGPVPALALMYLGDDEARPRGWYPTLVLPDGAATYIVNPV
jgi:hypothetical protein